MMCRVNPNASRVSVAHKFQSAFSLDALIDAVKTMTTALNKDGPAETSRRTR